MKGKKMPLHVYSDHPNWYDSKMYLNSKDYLDWLSSLQPCEISESELEKIDSYFYEKWYQNNNGFDSHKQMLESNPIDVTDIVEEKSIRELENKYKNQSSGTVGFAADYVYKDYVFFKQPKQVYGEIESVEFAEWTNDLIECDYYPVYNTDTCKLSYWENRKDNTKINTKQLYEIFKNRKP